MRPPGALHDSPQAPARPTLRHPRRPIAQLERAPTGMSQTAHQHGGPPSGSRPRCRGARSGGGQTRAPAADAARRGAAAVRLGAGVRRRAAGWRVTWRAQLAGPRLCAQGQQGGGPERPDGRHQVEPDHEPPAIMSHLSGGGAPEPAPRAARSELERLGGSGEMARPAVQSCGRERVVGPPVGRVDEGAARPVLPLAGLLPHRPQRRIGRGLAAGCAGAAGHAPAAAVPRGIKRRQSIRRRVGRRLRTRCRAASPRCPP